MNHDHATPILPRRALLPLLLSMLMISPVACSIMSGDGTGAAARPPAQAPAASTTPAASTGLPAPFRMGRPDLVVLVTGGIDGMLEPCHCGREMLGGQARRSSLVKAYRAAYPHTILLDTGDAFLRDDPGSIRNEYVVRGMHRIGYDAMVMGDQEWAVPNDRLPEILVPGRMIFLSTTVRSKALPALPLAETWARELSSLQVAVLSDNHDTSFYFMPPDKRPELTFLSPTQLADKVAAWKKRRALVIVATHGDNLQLEETARACDADLFLRGNTRDTEPELIRAAGKPVAKVGGDGQVGVIALKVRDGRIAAMEYRVESLDARWLADVALLENYGDYAQAAMRDALAAPRPESLAFVPSSACQECHPAQFAQWRKSKHGHAWQTLVDAKRSGDPDCMKCHVTGFGTRDGFVSIRQTPTLADVHCQVCHEMALVDHRRSARRMPPVTATLCAKCHTAVSDPKFNFAERVKQIACGKAPGR